MCTYRYRDMFQIVNWFGHFVQQQQKMYLQSYDIWMVAL